MKKALKSIKAFTLVELLIVIVLAVIATGIAYRIYAASTDSLDIVKEQNRNEMSVAISAENINNAIRYAASVFTMPESVFSTENLDAGWNYFGLITSKGALTVRDGSTDVVLPAGYSALVFIEYMGPSGTVVNIGSSQTLLYNDPGKVNENGEVFDECRVPASSGVFRMTTLCYDHVDTLTGYLIKYNLSYLPANGYDRIDAYTTSSAIRYAFGASYYEIKADGSIKLVDDEGNDIGDEMFNIDAYLNGMNLLQVAYKGTPSDPAVAIAFKNSAGITTTTETIKKSCNIVFVLDLSGSMEWDMEGRETSNNSKRRVTILKDRMIEFINMFKEYDTVNVSIVRFSSTASYETKNASNAPIFYCPAKPTDYDRLTSKSGIIKSLSATGGTNIGSGILGAIHALKRNPTLTNTADATNYVILITDGEVNAFLYSTVSKTTTEGDYPTNPYNYEKVISPYICKANALNGYTFVGFDKPFDGYETKSTINSVINITKTEYDKLSDSDKRLGPTEEITQNQYNNTDENYYLKWKESSWWSWGTRYYRRPYQKIVSRTYTYTGDFFYFGDINYNTSQIMQYGGSDTAYNKLRGSNYMSACLKALADPIDGTYTKVKKFWLVNLGRTTAVKQAEDIIYSFYGTDQGDYTEYFFNANDGDELKSSFTTIGNTIITDSGLITGPKGW